MIEEQSRAADAAEAAAKASERESAKREELEQQRYDEERARRDRVEGEKLQKEKWLQAQKLALTSIEGNLKSSSRSKDDLLKVVKTAHFFQLYSDNPFEEMDWLDRCNAFQGLLRDSIDEHKSEFMEWLDHRKFTPAVNALKTSLMSIQNDAIDFYVNLFEGDDEREKKVIRLDLVGSQRPAVIAVEEKFNLIKVGEENEIDVENREFFLGAGGNSFTYIKALND